MQRDEIVKAFAGVKMKRLLLPLLAALALPTAVNAERFELVNDGKYNQSINTDVIPIGLRKGDWINADIYTSYL